MVSRKTLAAGFLAGVVAFALTGVLYRRGGEARIDFERGYEGAFVRGFHPRERAGDAYFRWTDGASTISLENLPAGERLAVEARLKTLRPAGEPLPEIAFTANAVTVHRTRAAPGLGTYRFEFPSASRRLDLGIDSETFEAAGGRRLGVQVLGLTVAFSEERPPWTIPALWMGGAAVLLFAAGRLAGLPLLAAFAASLALALAFVHLLGLEAVRFSSYPREVAMLAAASLGFALLLRLALDRLRLLHPRERGFLVGILALLFLTKIAYLTYPLTLSSDAEFQANRMSELLQGNWYPTSVTQHEPPFRIPYPVALYVAAAPLSRLGLDLVTALELTTGLADVLVCGLLLYLGWRFLDDFRAGALAALLYPLVPMNLLSFSAGNFTNLFAISMLSLAFTLLVVSVSSGDRRAAAGCGLATFAALTAHFGMLLEAVVLCPLWIGLVWLLPAPIRDARRASTFAVAAGSFLAGMYYLGYADLVSSQWERVFEGGSAAGGGAVGLSLAAEQLGWVFLAAAFLGCFSFLRRPLGAVLSAAATGWLAATLFFLLLDLLTPIEVRYWLQALPLLALGAGSYLSRAFERGVLGKTAAVAGTLYIAVQGLRTLYESMVFRYH